MLYFTVAYFALFSLSRKIFSSEISSLLPCIIWGFSTQLVSHAIMARMYMMFAVFAVLNALVHAAFLNRGEDVRRKDYILLYIINLLGFLTQYYYYIFAFFLSAYTALFICRHKGREKAIKYCAAMLLSVFSAWAIFPGIVRTFLHGRGTEAIKNLSPKHSFISALSSYCSNIKEKVFYNIGPVVLCLCILSLLILLVRVVRKRKLSPHPVAAALAAAVGCYFLVIIKIAPYITDRYYFAVTPFIWLLFVYLIERGIGQVKKPAAEILIVALCAFSVVSAYKDGKIMYQFKSQAGQLEVMDTYSDCSCLYITNGSPYTIIDHAFELEKLSATKMIDASQTSLAESFIDDEKPQMIVYIDETLDQQATLDSIYENTKYKSAQLLYRGSGVWWKEIEEIYVYVLS